MLKDFQALLQHTFLCITLFQVAQKPTNDAQGFQHKFFYIGFISDQILRFPVGHFSFTFMETPLVTYLSGNLFVWMPLYQHAGCDYLL